MPEALRQFLTSLSMTDADDIDIWLDSDPDAVEQMREITYPLTGDSLHSPNLADKEQLCQR